MGRARVMVKGRFREKICEICGQRLPIIGHSKKIWKTNVFLSGRENKNLE